MAYRLPSGDAEPPYRSAETKLGIMPGFGGSVRLPRVCWARTARWKIIAAGKMSVLCGTR
ncbi:hypothetical protein KCP78_20120 [Salmonella enterica subsp. enterica]|nr:hypothetical protein KCP78_20120 [Salmonella enterica subsp. enterica]